LTGSPPSIFEVDPNRPDWWDAALAAAARALEGAGLVILPTETVYGLAARPDLPEATARVFEAKARPLGLNLPVLAAAPEGAWEVAAPDGRARVLAQAFWPGPLTLVLPRTVRSSPWDLGDHVHTVAVRVPDHRVTTALMLRTGPLAVTSANRSGAAPLGRAEDLVAAFGAAVAVYLFLPPGKPGLSGTPSTVVDLSSPKLRVRRTGAIGREDLSRTLSAPRPTR
jgi:L-threonylcarbamoyladenylate synthase